MAEIKCVFCDRSFSTKGTYGRHLDLKRGDALHPDADVEQLRKGVVRRGEKDNEPKVKKRKSEVSKRYNSKVDVKERNKLRRKERDLRIKARLNACEWYFDHIEPPVLELTSFAYAVATQVPSSLWPETGVPLEREFNLTVGRLTALDTAKSDVLFNLYAQWKKLLAEEQKAQWAAESARALRTHLGGRSLYELANAKAIVDKKQQELYEEYTLSEMFDMIASDSE